MLDRIKQGLRTLISKPKIDKDMDEEFRYHLEKAIAQNVARGMAPEDARRAALVGFGGIEQIKEASRDARGMRFVEEFFQDLRYGARVLLRSRGFTFVVVVMLGLGVGANTAIFSLVDKLLLRSLPVSQPDRLVKISAESVNPKFLNTIFSYPDYTDYRDQNRVFDGIVAYTEGTLPFGLGDGSKNIRVSAVSSNYYQGLGTDVHGRGFLPEEEKAETNSPVAIVSHAFWSGLGSDPNILGKPIVLNGETFTVVGVTARNFAGADLEFPIDVWIPLSMFHTLAPDSVDVADRRPLSAER